MGSNLRPAPIDLPLTVLQIAGGCAPIAFVVMCFGLVISAAAWVCIGPTTAKILLIICGAVSLVIIAAPITLVSSGMDSDFGSDSYKPRYGLGVGGAMASTAKCA